MYQSRPWPFEPVRSVGRGAGLHFSPSWENVAARAFWSYDIARVIGADFTLTDDFVQALTEEFTPVVESYRQLRLFPPAVNVASDASPQTKLLAMVGRD